MKKLALVLSLCSFTFACGGGGADEAMSRMKTARDKICKCSDLDCAKKAKDEFRSWMKSNRDKLKDEKPSKSFIEKFNAVEEEADACMDKLRDKDKPADPAPAPAAPPTE